MKAAARGRRILVVDDVLQNRKLAAYQLRQAGYDVDTASGGAEGLEVARRRPPDAILSDIMMPSMDGFAFCREARRDPALSAIPIVLVSSAYVEEADRDLAHKMGASALVVRTPDLRDATAALEEGLRRRDPVAMPAADEVVAGLHRARLQAQIERQTAQNQALQRQAAMQAAALSIMRGLSEVLSQPKEVTHVLGDVLVHCLDAPGLSIGLLYVRGPDGRLRLQAQFGIPVQSGGDAEECFGHADLILRILEAGEPLALSFATENLDAQSRDFLVRLGPSSVLVVPFAVLGQTFGTLVLASDSQDLSDTAWLGFARNLALQFGQTVALGQSLKRVAESEERYRALMEHANDAILILDVGKRVVEANLQAEQLLGRPRAGIVGHLYDEFIAPEQRADSAHRIEQLRRERVLRVESRAMVRPDGTRVSVEMSASAVRVGEDFMILTILRDVTERRRSEQALQRSEARMKSILDAALDAVVMMDAQGRVTSWNGRAEELFGWSRDEAVGAVLSELIIPPRYREAHRKGLARFLATGQGRVIGRRFELSAVRRDGSEFPIELKVTALQEGDVFFFNAFLVDITERKRAEEALQAAQRRLEHVVTSSPAVLYSLKVDGEVLVPTWVSANIERYIGYAPEELGGADWWSERVHPDDRARVVAEIATLLSGGALAREFRFRHKDGGYRWVRDQQRLLRDAEGRPAEVVGSWSDLTARKEAELRLQESEEQYRVLFDGNPHPMYVFDAETLAFLAVNDAAVHHYGYSRDEFLGMTLQEVCPPDEAPAFMRSINAALAVHDRSQTLGVFKHRKKDGTPLQMEIATNGIRLRGRQDWLVLALDVTEKRSLEAQLLQVQKMESVGRLAGGVAHDFNNILGVITGYAELLRRRLPSDPPQWHKYVDDILKAAGRAAGLTRQLLAFSRSQVLQPRILDLNEIVAEMEKMLRRLIGEDVRLITVLDAALPLIKADAGQLEQVLMNLVVNARDAMPRGGSLTIETGSASLDERYAAQHAGVRAGRYAMLAVSDTGHGMPPEVLERVFEPFFTTKEQGKGTGLGLATVHGIVKQSGGHVFVYSEVGRGTVFKVYLPLVEEAPLAAAPAVFEATPRGTETVLIVEDEETLREIIRECLESSGYVVLEAPEAEAAIEACERHPGTIHLLVSDVVMPGAGGRELANQLATRRPDMKVLYISGYTDDAVILHGVLTRDVPFLEKPFTCEALARKVREVLDR